MHGGLVMTISLNKQSRMSLNVPGHAGEAEAGTVTREEFISCIR
jgi:hypothetical protein